MSMFIVAIIFIKLTFLNPSSLQIIKYGVISTEALIDDLMHWKTLYVAGRLHKPVSITISLFWLEHLN